MYNPVTEFTYVKNIFINNKGKVFEREAIPWMKTIYNTAYRYSGNDTEARDLTQDVFLKAYESFHTFKEGTNCKAWLLKILKNTFLNYIKKKNLRVNYGQFDKLEESVVLEHSTGSSHQTSPEKAFTLRELDEGIQAALNKLPEDFRLPVILCDIEGLTYQEISEVLACPIGTIRSRINRARKFLKKELKEFL